MKKNVSISICINTIIQLNKYILMKRTIIFILIGENGCFICYKSNIKTYLLFQALLHHST